MSCLPGLRSTFATMLGFCLLASVGAQAQDGSAWKDYRVQALQACPAGGVKLADGSTCLRFSGVVRAESTTRIGGASLNSARSLTRSTVTRGGVVTYLNVDARTPTALGEVRTYASVRLANQPPAVLGGR